MARILVGWRKQHWYAPLVAGVVAVNLLFVFFAPARLLGQRVGTPTIAAISARDHFIAAGIAAIQAGRPDETLVVTSPLSYGFIEAYAPGYRYYLIPGLTPGIGSTTGAGRVTVLTNGLTPLSSASILGPGRVEAPAAARRVVLFSYEWDLPSMVVGTAGLMQPDPKVPTVAVVTSATAIDLLFRPGRLELITGNVAMAEAH